jgi:hypothetical protein
MSGNDSYWASGPYLAGAAHERLYDLEQWLTDLDGLDAGAAAAPVREQLVRVDELLAHRARLSKAPDALLTETIKRLADEPMELEQAYLLAATAGLQSNDDHRAAVTEVFVRATEKAIDASWNLMRVRAPRLVDRLSERLNEVASEAAKLSKAVPEPVSSLDSATRLGCHTEWLRLEELRDTWKDIHDLHKAWMDSNLIEGKRPDGRHTRDELRFKNVAALSHIKTPRHVDSDISPVWFARACEVGEPALLTPKMVDELQVSAAS